MRPCSASRARSASPSTALPGCQLPASPPTATAASPRSRGLGHFFDAPADARRRARPDQPVPPQHQGDRRRRPRPRGRRSSRDAVAAGRRATSRRAGRGAVTSDWRTAGPAVDARLGSLAAQPVPRPVRPRRSELPMVRLSQKFEFSATHRLHNPALSDDENCRIFGKCNNPHGHGHNYEVQVTLAGDAGAKTGVLVDVPAFERIVATTVIDRFDHKNLNVEVPEFADLIPSVENIARRHLPAAPAPLRRRRRDAGERDGVGDAQDVVRVFGVRPPRLVASIWRAGDDACVFRTGRWAAETPRLAQPSPSPCGSAAAYATRLDRPVRLSTHGGRVDVEGPHPGRSPCSSRPAAAADAPPPADDGVALLIDVRRPTTTRRSARHPQRVNAALEGRRTSRPRRAGRRCARSSSTARRRLRAQARALAVVFGDEATIADMRQTLADARRRRGGARAVLQSLLIGRRPDARRKTLQALVAEPPPLRRRGAAGPGRVRRPGDAGGDPRRRTTSSTSTPSNAALDHARRPARVRPPAGRGRRRRHGAASRT